MSLFDRIDSMFDDMFDLMQGGRTGSRRDNGHTDRRHSPRESDRRNKKYEDTDLLERTTPFSLWGGESMDEMFRHAYEEASHSPKNGDKSSVFCSATHEVRLPDGTRQLTHTSRDSRTGREVNVRTRALGDRSVTERSERDMRTGAEQRRRDLLNIPDDKLQEFEHDWQEKAPGSNPKSLFGGDWMKALM